MPQEVIREHQGDHRFDDRNRAGKHACIVASLGSERRGIPIAIDGVLRAHDRRRRLERDAKRDRLGQIPGSRNGTSNRFRKNNLE